MAKDISKDILQAALHEISKYGADFHMDDLAKNLHISKRTLYEHFSSKQEIVRAAFISVQDELYEQHLQILENPNISAEEKLIGYFQVKSPRVAVMTVREMNALLAKMPDVRSELLARSRRDWQLLQRFFEVAQESDAFRHFYTPLLMHMLQGAVNDILDHLHATERDYSYPEYMEECIRIILYGIKRQGANDK